MATSGTTNFPYTTDRSDSIFAQPFYDDVRRYRPQMVEHLKAIHDRNLMFFSSLGENDSRCVVYAAINRHNNKIYIGATEKGVATRRYHHFWVATNGRPGLFNRAIRKHGKESFDFLILARCKDFFDALSKERRFIAAVMPEYNLTAGGGGIKGYKFTAEQIERGVSKRRGKSNKKKDSCLSDQSKLKVSDAITRWWKENNERLGLSKIASENVKKAIAARQKAVLCLDDGKEFISASEAARHYGIGSSQVTLSCRRYPNHQPRKHPKFRYTVRPQ